jgi:hypothetical protein
MRLIAAFLLAPAAVMLALSVLMALGATRGTGSPFAFLFFALPIVYASSAAFGAPLFWLFRRSGWLAWWHAGLGGLASALPCAALLVLGNPGSLARADGLMGPLLCFGVGSAAALVFWAIAIRNNPALLAARDDAGRSVSPNL